MNVAIVGAGISGLACADALEAAGIGCVLFDKGRRPGGRLSSLQLADRAWDFGAQYFRAGSGRFARQITEWVQAGLVAEWPGGPEGALVGVPTMASLVAAQCERREVRFEAQVDRLDHGPAGWMLSGRGLAEGPFDAVVLCVPPEQAIPLVSLHDFHLARQYVDVRSQPCWTAMVGFAEPLRDLADYARDLGPIAWAARNNSKPGRPAAECWVLQAGADWSRCNLELPREAAGEALLAAFADAVPGGLPPAQFLKAHRWRFALASPRTGRTAWNAAIGLGVCGDWCATARVEGAWRSGNALAREIVASPIAPPIQLVSAAGH